VPLALTGYQSLLLGVALTFIAVALTVALLIPRWRPEFPSRHLGWFIAGAIILFACQLTAVLLLANLGEKEAEAANGAGGTQTAENQTLPATTTPSPPPPTKTTPTQTTPTQTSTAPGSTTQTSTTPSGTTTPGQQGNAAAGKQVFLSQPCGGCHTLKDAGTSGTVGPNLDQLKPPYDKVVTQVTNGGAIMPPFKGKLTPQQIQDVAAYVSSVAGK
jgi:mono/diheme cytochrome c family protein